MTPTTTPSDPAKDAAPPLADESRRSYLIMVQPPLVAGAPIPQAIQAEISPEDMDSTAEFCQERAEEDSCGLAQRWLDAFITPLGLTSPTSWNYSINLGHALTDEQASRLIEKALRDAGFQEVDVIESDII